MYEARQITQSWVTLFEELDLDCSSVEKLEGEETLDSEL
jgi:hypothetical protein